MGEKALPLLVGRTIKNMSLLQKNELIEKGYIPLDKSWIIRMGMLDFFNGYRDIFTFLKKHRKDLPDDLLSLERALAAWKSGKGTIPVGESGTLYRFLQFAAWKRGERKRFSRKGTLRSRSVAQAPELVRFPLSRLLRLDKNTSQWASAAVLFGNTERPAQIPFKLKVTYEALSHWERMREKGKIWEPRYDETILRQALAFLKIRNGKRAQFSPLQAEDYCFARAFGFMKRSEAARQWPNLKSHESDRLKEMEQVIRDVRNAGPIRSRDHRAVQAGALLQRAQGKPVRVIHRTCVSKSWPQFWKFLRDHA